MLRRAGAAVARHPPPKKVQPHLCATPCRRSCARAAGGAVDHGDPPARSLLLHCVNLCELSVPGTEARCRPSHYRLSDDPQLRTGARKNCTIDDAALTWACPPPAPAPNCFAGGVKSVNLCELSVPGTEARCHRDEG